MFTFLNHYLLLDGKYYKVNGEIVVKHNDSLLTISGKFVARNINELNMK